jgi:hypothetical protein
MKNLLFLASLIALPVFGQEKVHVTGAKITEVGIYQAQVKTDTTNSAGLKLQEIADVKLLKTTTNVPARLGVRFGFRYEILGAPTNASITLSMVAKHPPIKNPVTGKTTIWDSYQLRSWIGKTFTCNSLDTEPDLVPGKWTFEIWHEGKKLCEQSFLVVPNRELDQPKR